MINTSSILFYRIASLLILQVLRATADDAKAEHLEDQDDIHKLLGRGAKKPGFRRQAGSLAARTGGRGLVYKEQTVPNKDIGKVLAALNRKNYLKTK